MKIKLSVSINEETAKMIEQKIEQGIFRNKSHAVEFALNSLREEK